MRKIKATPLLIKSTQLANQHVDSDKLYMSLQERLQRFADKKVTTLMNEDSEASCEEDPRMVKLRET